MPDIEKIRDIVSEYGSSYGADRIYLFGSYARGEMTDRSDIDLRIDKGRIRGLQFAGLLGDLLDALGVDVDLISTDGMNKDFLDAIMPEEVLLYERRGA